MVRLDSPHRPALHTLVTFATPHVGAYCLNNLITAGLWVFAKIKKSESLRQLALKDTADPRQSFLYQLSLDDGQ